MKIINENQKVFKVATFGTHLQDHNISSEILGMVSQEKPMTVVTTC